MAVAATVKKPISGTGRRKTSVARVIVKKGRGVIMVNGKTLEEYFTYVTFQTIVKQPLAVLGEEGKLDVQVNVNGGGVHSQAEAVRHGLSRALLVLDETNRPVLKANGFLSRDSRMVERKKYGQKKARKKFQFSKR